MEKPQLAVAWTLAFALVCASAWAERRGSATSKEPRANGQTGEVAVLRSPSSPEVLIRGGEFIMGSPPTEVVAAVTSCRTEVGNDFCDEIPFPERAYFQRETDLETMFANELDEHPVSLSAYWIDRREVTVRDYRRCADVGPCRMPDEYETGGERFDRPDLPIVFVSWDDASTFCTWRNARLPSEAEWERAARGPKSRRYPWGNTYNRQNANHGTLTFDVWRGDRVVRDATDTHDGFVELAPVGSFPDGRTVEGIDDMAGNAAEWVGDFYSARYDPATAGDPKGPATPPVAQAPFRVHRGGSYQHAAPWMRGSARLMALAAERDAWLGFRCARDGG